MLFFPDYNLINSIVEKFFGSPKLSSVIYCVYPKFHIEILYPK